DDNDDADFPILLDAVHQKTRLKATNKLSKFFDVALPEYTIHILVQRPSQSPSVLDSKVALLRKQLSEVLDSPEKKVACTWSAVVEKTTLGDLKVLFQYYPQYGHDDYLEIFVYNNGFSKPEAIRDDEDLRKILRIAKTQSRKQLTIALETQTKTFSAWTFKDACAEYNLSETNDAGVEVLPPFTDIQAAPLDSDFRKKILDRLINEVESRVNVLKLLGVNEATKSMIVASFMVAATRLFEEDLYLASQRNLSGRRGIGPVDFSMHSRKTHSYTLNISEVKKNDFRQDVTQNIVQLESALTGKKRKNETYEIDGEKEPPMKMRSYRIVTDASMWLLIECTLHEDETVSYTMPKLEQVLSFDGRWRDDAKFVFERFVWLWSRMRDEIPARESYSRKLISSPSIKKDQF
ncbi:hypothetical protein BG011_001958, partial [Mortierella polycephala]